MKRFFIFFAIALPFAFLAEFLEAKLGDSWRTVLVFCVVLLLVRVLVYFYRRLKGIPDNFHE